MRVLVCGGRNFNDWDAVQAALDGLHFEYGVRLIIHGGASGADTAAHAWAVERGVSAVAFQPEWHKYGRAAGPIRNQQMLDIAEPDLCVAFPGGKGTADMIGRAKKAGLDVIEVRGTGGNTENRT